MEENIVGKLKPILEKLMAAEGIHLFDVEFLQEEGTHFLRVSIEKPDQTMDFETCEKMSEIISKKLDELDPIDYEYILETCSPGIERPIRNQEEWESALNQYISVYVAEMINQKEVITGTLKGINATSIVMEYKDKTRLKEVVIENKNIVKAHYAVKF